MLRCPNCHAIVAASLIDRIAILRTRGRLLRDPKPDERLVQELLVLELDTLKCDKCGNVGLQFSQMASDESVELGDEHWGEARRCCGCNAIIDPERIEILPDTRQCTTCSASGRLGNSDDREFCDRCGGLMKMTARRGPGLSGYTMRCSDCGH